MKKIKYALLACAFLLFSSSAIQAEEQGRVVGFEFGVNYHSLTDTRFEGSAQTFSLEFPIEKGLTVGIYHENTRLSGEETVAGAKVNTTVNVSINQLRVKKELGWRTALFLGLGQGSTSNGIIADAPVGDVGVQISPVQSKGKLLDSKLSINLVYRFFRIPSAATFGAAPTDPVDDLGGISAGLSYSFHF